MNKFNAEDYLERCERSVVRLRKFIDLQAPRFLIDDEVRLLGSFALAVLSAMDEPDPDKAKLDRERAK